MKKTRDHKDRLIELIQEVTDHVKDAVKILDSDRHLVQKKRQIAEFNLNTVRPEQYMEC